MGTAQLEGRTSLRNILSNLLAQSPELCNLGIGDVSRLSLAWAHAEKPLELLQELFGRLPPRHQSASPGHAFRFKAKLFWLES